LFCAELMPDFQPTSEVTWSKPLNQTFPLPIMILILFLLLTEHSACPSSQEYYLQCRRPDLSTGIQVPNSGSANG
jgi:hypothetical protein